MKERCTLQYGLMAGEPRAHEGSYVFAHPVDVAHDLTHDAAILNEVSFRKHICPKAFADLSGPITMGFHQDTVIGQEISVFHRVLVAPDRQHYDALRSKPTCEIPK